MQFGIPTVIESAVIVNEAIDLFIEKLQEEGKSNENLNNLRKTDNYEEIKEILNPRNYNLVVTPKEIDDLTRKFSKSCVYRNKFSFVTCFLNTSLWLNDKNVLIF